MLPGARAGRRARRSPFARVHSDTRSLRAGDLFVALRGERFDAHDFLGQAKAAGAVAALAERGLAEAGLPGLEVADTPARARRARRRLAAPLRPAAGRGDRQQRQDHGDADDRRDLPRLAAATPRFATEGNFNNDIGVPLTLLRLRAGCIAPRWSSSA